MFPSKLPIISQPTDFPNTYSLEFDGTDDDVNMGDINLINTDDYSISAWFKTSTVDTKKMLFSKGRNYRWNLGISVNNKPYLEHNSVPASIVTVIGTTTVTDGNWHHVIVTADRDGNLSLYIDGNTTPEATADVSSATGTVNEGSYDVYVGAYSKSSGGNRFTGNIDEVAIFNDRILTSGEVSSIYNSGKSTDLSDESGLVGYWRFEEGSGVSALDSSDGGNNGTINGSASYDTDVPS